MGTPPLSSGEKRVTSYDEASKFFDRPLSDAADSLGVCSSVLKKICYDNGLLRWPYRKVLSGKTIEEIKKEAAIEMDKQLAKSKISVALHSSPASSSISFQPTAGSLHESLQSRTITPQPSKDNQTQPHLTSTMNKENSAISDEFKYGFPSDGLSSVEYRWWGNKCETQNSDDIEKDTVETKRQDGEKNKVETKQQDDNEKDTVETKQETVSEKNNAETPQQDNSEKNNAETTQQDNSEKNNVERNQQDDSEKNNAETNQQGSEISAADVLPIDEEMKEHKSNEKDGDNSEWASSLSCMRKKAVKEARNAKKLGVYRQYGAQTLNQAKRSVLVQIFKSSLPSEWGDDIVN